MVLEGHVRYGSEGGEKAEYFSEGLRSLIWCQWSLAPCEVTNISYFAGLCNSR